MPTESNDRSPSDLQATLIHAGEPSPRIDGAVVMPIFQSAMYEQQTPDDRVRYIRYNNTPNHEALHAKLAAVEGAEAALVTGSGMGAISSAILSVVSAGDHLLLHEGCYGGTQTLVTELLPTFGVEHTFLPHDATSRDWHEALRPSTTAFYTEAITNPTLDVHDLQGVADFSRANGLTSIIDATFATPVNLRPVDLGFDVVVHSATKYYGGHSDLVAGIVVGRGPAVSRVEKVLKLTGATLDPHACFLLHRSLKTLGVRMDRHNASGQALAEFLEAHDAVKGVRYPGLASHPDHERARTLFGGFGGMIALELADDVDGDAFLGALQFVVKAPSLGGPETLITRPAFSSHAGLSPEERTAAGITEGLFRISTGLEEAAAIQRDIAQALSRARVQTAQPGSTR